MKKVDYDKPLPMYIMESCIECGKFVRTKDKANLTLFLMDHYGIAGIRRCSKSWYGKYLYTLLNWRHRNY